MRAIVMALDRTRYPTSILIRFSATDVRFATVNGNECPIDQHDRAVSQPSEAGGQYEPHVVQLLRRVCQPGTVALDIGANIGCHTITMATHVGPSGRCYAFEPNSENCRLILLACNHNNLRNVTLAPVALSDFRGYAYFSTHLGSNGGIVPEQFVALKGNGVIVPVFTLDSFNVDHADVIKIDIEGGEYKALKGGASLLSRSRPVIISEFSIAMTEQVSGASAREYFDWIESLKYKLFLLDRTSNKTVPIKSISALLADWGSIYRIEDLVFVPHEKLHLI
jgi:FkbM family methyltransferase